MTAFEYDKQGRRVKTTYPNGDTTHNPPAIYDIRGRVITQYDMRGNPTHFEYDSAGRQIKVTDALNHSTWTQYNAAGQRIAVKDALGRVTKFTYDVFGRLTETEFPPAATGQPVTTKKTEYDKLDLFRDAPVQKEILSGVMGDIRFRIPPGETNFEVAAEFPVTGPIRLRLIMP